MKCENINIAMDYLNELKGSNLVSIGRASSLAWFLFAKNDVEYALHLQTSFRVIINETIAFASADIFQPSETIVNENNFTYDNFDWDIQGNNKYDEQVDIFSNKFSYKLITNNISINHLGDLSIELSDNVKIEVFIESSKEECWRFFIRHSNKHLIISGEDIIIDN